MKIWIISAAITVSATTRVEAETKEEALEITSERMVVIGRNHNDEEMNECLVISEADGEPYDFEVESEVES